MTLLDTTFLIDLLKEAKGVKEKSSELDKQGKVHTTEINVFELVYGACAGSNKDKDLKIINELISGLIVLPLDRAAAQKAGEIAGTLHSHGQKIGDADSLIAGIALSNGIQKIVTRNKRHFEKISELIVEEY